MKKGSLILVISLLILSGCSNKLEDDKNEYLSYKSELQKKEEFDTTDELDFDTFFNIVRDSDEKVNYNMVIENPKINMYNVKALLIHDFMTEDVYPTVGIFDKPVSLLIGEDKKIELKGTIQTTDDISNTKFKLYLEYENDDGLENKVFYEVARG